MKLPNILTKPSVFALLLLFACVQTIHGNLKYEAHPWAIIIDDNDGGVSLLNENRQIIAHSSARWGLDSVTTSFRETKNITTEVTPLNDKFGKGIKVTISGKKDSNRISQNFYLYKGLNYIFTDFSVSADNTVRLNFMAPIDMTEPLEMFKSYGNNILFVPFDNDAWVRFRVTPFGNPAPESHEVSAMFNSDSREGIVIGSIEHDSWKTGVKIVSSDSLKVDSLCVYGGIATELTRDVKSHGAVQGTTVKSPKIMLGLFDDWREGLETFADICNIITPQISSQGEKPFGWNSWGKIQSNINFDNASQTAEFFNKNLQTNTFTSNDTTVYIGLDSFWDCGFTSSELKKFADSCHKHGQKAGIYYCPFTDWIKNENALVEEAPEYSYSDIYLRHNDSILNFDGAYAIDPTHPATKKRISHKINQFIEWGYDFLKIDFLAHGTYEADSYYDQNVTTGIQAYNKGMAYLDSVVNNRLWINLSIAPLFPANYAHSRRIGCDAWADIKNTEYTLNALTYGWWLDHVYHYNDGDHIVMEGVSDGENRARLTSSAITGLFFLGDDLSKTGSEETKNKVMYAATNPDINEMARRCKSFRPVEHGIEDKAADMFYYIYDDVMYLAIFNFTDNQVRKPLKFHRLGLNEINNYLAEELWSHTSETINNGCLIDIPPKDVKVFRIKLS